MSYRDENRERDGNRSDGRRVGRVARWAGAAAGFLGLLVLVSMGLANGPSGTSVEDPDAPRYDAEGALVRPTDYREWVYLTSGLGMTYGPSRPEAGAAPRFDNIFVNRSAHRSFLETGTWPDETILILEVREAEANVSINNGGRTQGQVVAIEAAVKDRERFAGSGWGFFSFDGEHGPTESAAVLPSSASCYACHATHGAVDSTFVQFYPTLFEVAKRLGTIEPTYDPARKP